MAKANRTVERKKATLVLIIVKQHFTLEGKLWSLVHFAVCGDCFFGLCAYREMVHSISFSFPRGLCSALMAFHITGFTCSRGFLGTAGKVSTLAADHAAFGGKIWCSSSSSSSNYSHWPLSGFRALWLTKPFYFATFPPKRDHPPTKTGVTVLRRL